MFALPCPSARAPQHLQMPHLLFYGPPGTGKTSTILAISRQLFGYASASAPSSRAGSLLGRPELFKERVLELNASDDRGIQAVREKVIFVRRREFCDGVQVKSFAQQTVNRGGPGSVVHRNPMLTRRRIQDHHPRRGGLDDVGGAVGAAVGRRDAAGCVTPRSRTMEAYSKVTRFCLICNYVSRCRPRTALHSVTPPSIIEPLASRCAKFRFKPLSADTVLTRLSEIRAKERVSISDEARHCTLPTA